MPGRPKLLTRPPRRTGSLDRPRIVELGGTRAIVALCGASGSGTSTAAAEIGQSGALPFLWCRLADGYSGAADLVEMVADVLGAEIEPRLRVIDLADQLLELIERTPHSIVIDDHHLADADLDRLIAELSGLLEPEVRIIIAGESRPAGLIGLLSPTDITVLEADDLAFTDEEAVDFFVLHGGDAKDALRWNAAVGGWPVALAAGAMNPEAPAAEHLAPLITRAVEADPTIEAVLDAAAAIPYVTGDLLAALDIDIPPDRLESLTRTVSFLAQHDSYVQLSGAVVDLRREAMSTERLADLRKDAGIFLANSDPVTAIEVLIEAGEPEAAAEVLADHLSEIGVERALNWLYRFPDDLRRRFPPVLAAGRATVEVDTALAVAQARVETANDSQTRREALYALGSVESFRGELAAAAGAFEAAMRSGADDAEFVDRVSVELATTRWLLGDIIGARASLRDAGDTSGTRWLAAQLDLFDEQGGGVIADLPAGETPDALDLSVLSLAALRRGDDIRSSELASAAYASAVGSGGNDLVAAGPVHAWMALRMGDIDEALVVAEEVERRLGPRHQLARVHGALIRERCSRIDGDAAANERDQRRLRDLRATGYGSIEEMVNLVVDRGANTDGEIPSLMAPEDILVTILGVHTVRVGDRVVGRSDWKSKKALEVLTALTLHGSRGARREQIIEAVWPDRPPDKGRTLLRTALSDIRRVLEPGRPAGEKSRFISTEEDRILVDGVVDIDEVEAIISTDPVAAFKALTVGLAVEVVGVDWGEDLEPRLDRLVLISAAAIPDSADWAVRLAALEALITGEPWQRNHYDTMAAMHRDAGDELAAADVERRWFADD